MALRPISESRSAETLHRRAMPPNRDRWIKTLGASFFFLLAFFIRAFEKVYAAQGDVPFASQSTAQWKREAASQGLQD